MNMKDFNKKYSRDEKSTTWSRLQVKENFNKSDEWRFLWCNLSRLSADCWWCEK